ncbi:hypothetical protein ABZP36_001694 [Zizania latifolia]
MPGLTLGDTVPNLELDSTHGKIRIHDFVGHGYAIIFSHPGDFTPVCTTELSAMAGYAKEFEKRGVKLLGISCDDVKSHKEWIKDIEAYKPGNRVTYPIMADPDRQAIRQLNMVDPDEKDSDGGELPSRALHIVGPDKKVKLSILYPACAGRNIDEVVRAVDALQTAAKHAVATPANWRPGERVVIPPGVSDEEARRKFPKGFDTADLPSRKGYLRFTECCGAVVWAYVEKGTQVLAWVLADFSPAYFESKDSSFKLGHWDCIESRTQEKLDHVARFCPKTTETAQRRHPRFLQPHQILVDQLVPLAFGMLAAWVNWFSFARSKPRHFAASSFKRGGIRTSH